MKSQEIRERFRDFFVARSHEAWPSDAIVPKNDPTLLFTSAGMVQFKPYFRGEMGDALKRATTCQKCFRTSDIENVGYTERHHTFFEMLGNFSFGDYFKREAIRWAWEFSVDEMKLDPNNIWGSIFVEDDESEKIWLEETGLPRERIIRLGEEDNFWPGPGILGPSGPCSELYYDQGPEVDPDPNCRPGDDSDRYLEYWNLVFTQYDRQEDGTLLPLTRKNIDTGLGLERLACLMQGVHSNFDTDLLRPIIQFFEEQTGYQFHQDKINDVSFRVLADHIRATLFVLTDNVMPANTGRGYVLRRIMRRAIRHGLQLGIEKDLLAPAMQVAAEVNQKEYPDLAERLRFTQKIAAAEEEAFRSTLNRGLAKLEEMIDEMRAKGQQALPGERAFTLYDTYGFPSDLTNEILRERGFKGYNREVFEQCMEEQRARAQAAWKGSGETKVEVDVDIEATEFTGYASLREESEILGLFRGSERLDSALAGQDVELVVKKTPFYAESGGQVGDKGSIETQDGQAAMTVETTRKTASGVYVHIGRVDRGTLRPGQTAKLTVDAKLRRPTMRNHTATHLLHAALRRVLGTHVKQSGSLVAADSLRFDFTHFESLSPEQLQTIENIINQWVYENHPVQTEITTFEEAQKRGAMALFGEKYGDQVRLVKVDGDKPVSMELCGGTHVRTTGEIGPVRIVHEGSVSAGNRRIEAVSGPRAIEYTQTEHELLRRVTSELRATPSEAPERISRLNEQIKQLERENKELKQKLLRGETQKMDDSGEEINGIRLLIREMDAVSSNEMQTAMDAIMQGAQNRVAVLTSKGNGKITFICGVSDDLTHTLNAGQIAKEMAQLTGGGGGGRKNRAQAGGKNPAKLPEAYNRVKEILQQVKA